MTMGNRSQGDYHLCPPRLASPAHEMGNLGGPQPRARLNNSDARICNLQSACPSACSAVLLQSAVCTGSGSLALWLSGTFAYSGFPLPLTSLSICLPPSASPPPFPLAAPSPTTRLGSSRRPAYPQACAASGRAKRIGPRGSEEADLPFCFPLALVRHLILNFWGRGAVAGVCVLQYQNSSIITNITTITNTFQAHPFLSFELWTSDLVAPPSLNSLFLSVLSVLSLSSLVFASPNPNLCLFLSAALASGLCFARVCGRVKG